MSDPRLFRIRFTYVKSGRLALLSHLEVTRALERAVRRAQLPYAVSQGFSPHMKVSLCSALPVGVGSTCEAFDLMLTEYLAPAKALERLRDASAADLAPVDARYIAPQAPAVGVALSRSMFTCEVDGAESLSAAFPSLSVPQAIEVQKKDKVKVLQVPDYLVDGPCWQDGRIVFTLQAGESGSLRPDILMRRCLQETGIPDDAVTAITRTALETQDAE